MKRVLTFVAVFGLLVAILTALTGINPRPISARLADVATYLNDFDPIPSLPTYPETPAGDDSFFSAFANLFRYIGQLGRWLGQFLVWMFDLVVTLFHCISVLLFDGQPPRVVVV